LLGTDNSLCSLDPVSGWPEPGRPWRAWRPMRGTRPDRRREAPQTSPSRAWFQAA